ncbi:MAG: hypothetical protein EOP64_00365 [Sphingomonas sp.]|nr:MAG: hypothetical protein EOP64_00365 [Sphingomonas sp.]
MHFAVRKRLLNQYRLWIRFAMRRERLLAEARPSECRALYILRRGKRLLDYGNLVGGMKLLVDAIVRENLLFDDSPAWVHDTYAQQICKTPATLIWVGRVGEPCPLIKETPC